MSDVADDGEHHELDAGLAEVLRVLLPGRLTLCSNNKIIDV